MSHPASFFLAIAMAVPGIGAVSASSLGSGPAPSIVGGKDVPDGTYPFLLSVQRLAAGATPLERHWCGATLIAPEWALTAAHCVRGDVPGNLAVRVAETDLASGRGHDVAVATIHIHPDYPFTLKADVALLRLARPLTGVPAITLAGLAGAQWEQPGLHLTVAGWGLLDARGGQPARMQHVEVPFISTPACQRLYRGRALVDATLEMCASAPGRDACRGDSGGPLMVQDADRNWLQLGVVNWGLGCARDDSPGVHARLAAPDLIAFIRNVMAGG